MQAIERAEVLTDKDNWDEIETQIFLFQKGDTKMGLRYDGTVGLSRGVTPNLHAFGRILIIICMYLGRIGPVSLALFFHTQNGGRDVRYVYGRFFVG